MVPSYRDSSIKDLIRSVRHGGNHALTDLILLFKDKEHPRVLIPELCRLFYKLGWVTGTGGGISLRHGLVKAFHTSNKIHRVPQYSLVMWISDVESVHDKEMERS